MSPRVSVVLPFRDPGRYFPAAVACVLRQTFRDFELLAVDDGSADGSAAWAEALPDPRVRVLRSGGRGLVAALNLGLEASRGELVARMDADDLCAPDRFAEQVAFLDARSDAVLVGSRFVAIDGDDGVLYEVPVPSDDREIREGLRRGNRFQHGSVLMRRAAAVDAGGYRAAMRLVEDYDLWTRLAERGSVANLPKVLYWWRIHGAGVSFSNFARQEAMARLVRRCADARRAGRREPLEDALAVLDARPTGLRALLAGKLARARLARWVARCDRLRGRRGAAARGYARAAALCPWDPYLYEELLLDLVGGRDRRRRANAPPPPAPDANPGDPPGVPRSRAEGGDEPEAAAATGLRRSCS